MLQVETQGVPPRLQSRSVTSWVPKPLLLLQIKMNDEPSVKYLNLQQLGARNPSICYRSRQRKTSNLNISICNNNSAKTIPDVTERDKRRVRLATVSICNIWSPVLLLTVTEKDKPLTPGAADKVTDGPESPLACRWRIQRGCSPHCRRTGGVQTVGLSY